MIAILRWRLKDLAVPDAVEAVDRLLEWSRVAPLLAAYALGFASVVAVLWWAVRYFLPAVLALWDDSPRDGGPGRGFPGAARHGAARHACRTQ